MKSLVTILVCAFGLTISGVSFSSGGTVVKYKEICGKMDCSKMDGAACQSSMCCKIEEETPVDGQQPCVKKTPGKT